MRILGTLSLLFFASLMFAQEADSLKDAFKKGDLILDLRLRVESVDQNLIDKDALATTLRTRFGFKTAKYKGNVLYLDFENITAFDEHSYNSTTNGVTNRPVVADPESTEVNQLYLDCSAFDNQLWRIGRQRIILDNARFVGNVGWRQNEQTFDALMWQYKGFKKTTLSLAYLHNVNRIFGDDHGAGDFKLNSFVAHGKIAKTPVGDLSVFGYFLENEDVPLSSHKDLGLRLTGKWQLNDTVSLVHDISYADQSSFQDGADHIDADYMALSWGPKWSKYHVKLGYELLSGDGSYGFATPFATLHAFNGWADKFLGTPAKGLADTYLNFGYINKGWKFLAFYHEFESDQDSESYGSELDWLIAKKLNKFASLGLKYADYSEDGFSVDTTKLWGFTQLKW